MTYELITTWGEPENALEKVLARATRTLAQILTPTS